MSSLALFSLHGQTAVITGAARGLGLSFASVLASAGANIAAIDILETPSPELHELSRRHDVQVKYYQCDICSSRQITDTVSKVVTDFGSINININAAGIVTDEPFLSTTESNLDRTYNVNFKGSFLVAQACARNMIQQQAQQQQQQQEQQQSSQTNLSIVFIASISTHLPSSSQTISSYIASKSAVRGLVKPLALELAPFGIRVNSLSPGYTMTDMMYGLQKSSPHLVEEFAKESMFGRIGEPEDLAGLMLMLCSKAGGWITGQDLLVDGGAAGWKGTRKSDGRV